MRVILRVATMQDSILDLSIPSDFLFGLDSFGLNWNLFGLKWGR